MGHTAWSAAVLVILKASPRLLLCFKGLFQKYAVYSCCLLLFLPREDIYILINVEGGLQEIRQHRDDMVHRKQIQVKFEIQIYKVREGEYCIDIQVWIAALPMPFTCRCYLTISTFYPISVTQRPSCNISAYQLLLSIWMKNQEFHFSILHFAEANYSRHFDCSLCCFTKSGFAMLDFSKYCLYPRVFKQSWYIFKVLIVTCLQRIQGELFLFMDLCGNIIGTLGL